MGPDVKKKNMSENELLTIKLRVCVVLKYWMTNQFNDFDMPLINSLEKFIINTVKGDKLPQMQGNHAYLLINNEPHYRNGKEIRGSIGGTNGETRVEFQSANTA